MPLLLVPSEHPRNRKSAQASRGASTAFYEPTSGPYSGLPSDR
jgi:hypothetical protein